jgi:SSS family solute:Na+ symporter
VFHILAYGTFQFVLKDLLPVHFLHLYAILFVLEVAIMLVIGVWRPRAEEAVIRQTAEVDLTPWAYAQPCAVTLLSCVVALYVVFSPIGLAGTGSNLFAPVLLGLLALNVLFWLVWRRRLIAGAGVHA